MGRMWCIFIVYVYGYIRIVMTCFLVSGWNNYSVPFVVFGGFDWCVCVRVRVSVGARVFVTSTVRIVPGQLLNINSWSAVLVDHAPDSVWLNDQAPENASLMSLTLLTSQFEIFSLNSSSR